MSFVNVSKKIEETAKPVNNEATLQEIFDSKKVFAAKHDIPTETGYIEKGTYIWGVHVDKYEENGACELTMREFGTKETARACFDSFDMNDHFSEEPALAEYKNALDEKYKRLYRVWLPFIIILIIAVFIAAPASFLYAVGKLVESAVAVTFLKLEITVIGAVAPILLAGAIIRFVGKSTLLSLYKRSINNIREELNENYSLNLNDKWLYIPVEKIE